MFAFQTNNSTRLFEYPFAFFNAHMSQGMDVVEIGGGLSGFQYVLAKQGVNVINVDPGLEACGRGWPVDYQSIAKMNRAFGTRVVLKKCFIQDANFLDNSFDRCFSISIIEHLTDKEIISILNHVKRVLKPGGLFILTVDLFLDLKPFTKRESNEYGRNVSIQKLVDLSGMEMTLGKREELFGFPEFDPEKILSDLSRYMLGNGYPALAQLLVLRK
jgi:ubiquinone/menaquinone biosynthesis C-methylase UbiE